MKFQNETTYPLFDSVAKKAESLLDHDSKMMKEVRKKNDFQYDSGSGMNVYCRLAFADGSLPIRLFSPKHKGTSSMGYYQGGVIYVNRYVVMQISFSEWVGFVIHEFTHHRGFHHNSWIWFLNNRKTVHKCRYSVPYFLSENIERWL